MPCPFPFCFCVMLTVVCRFGSNDGVLDSRSSFDISHFPFNCLFAYFKLLHKCFCKKKKKKFDICMSLLVRHTG